MVSRNEVARIRRDWLGAVVKYRQGSAVDLLITSLPGSPVVSISSAATLMQRSFQAANEAMNRLEAAGVVKQINLGRRNRAFEAPDIIDAFAAFERQLSSSTGDRRSAPPDRPVPARR